MRKFKIWPRSKPVSLDKTEAVTAAKAANRRLQQTQALWPEVTGAANRLAEIRRKNHFAELIRSAVLGEGPE